MNEAKDISRPASRRVSIHQRAHLGVSGKLVERKFYVVMPTARLHLRIPEHYAVIGAQLYCRHGCLADRCFKDQPAGVVVVAAHQVGASGKVDGSGGTTTVAGNSVRGNLVTQFNQLKDQLDKTAQDASFNGINLLNGDALKLFFNENSTSSLTIQSTNVAGINSSTLSIGSATNTEFQSNSSLDTRLQTLHTALTTVASQSSAFGSNLSIVQNRQDFTNNMVNTLQVGSDGLTLADTNLEGANMMALQTRQQLSITALSLASQANQAVLRLFG